MDGKTYKCGNCEENGMKKKCLHGTRGQAMVRVASMVDRSGFELSHQGEGRIYYKDYWKLDLLWLLEDTLKDFVFPTTEKFPRPQDGGRVRVIPSVSFFLIIFSLISSI